MFNLGAGEVTVLLLVGLILFGPKTLSELADGLREGVRRLDQGDRLPRRGWRLSDWLLASAALIFGSLAVAMVIAV